MGPEAQNLKQGRQARATQFALNTSNISLAFRAAGKGFSLNPVAFVKGLIDSMRDRL